MGPHKISVTIYEIPVVKTSGNRPPFTSIYIRQSLKTPALRHFLVFWLGRSGGTNSPATQLSVRLEPASIQCNV